MELVCQEARTCAKFEKTGFPYVSGALLLAIFAIISFSAVCPPTAHAGQAKLAWDANSSAGVVGYKLYYGTSSGNYSQSLDVGNATSFTVGNLTEGKTYYFAAKAYDSTGILSEYSNEANATISSSSPVTPSLTVNMGGAGGGTVTSIPSGIACTIGPCTDLIETGSAVTLMATPDSDSTFAGWSGACTNKTGDCVISVNADASVIANFDAAPFARIEGADPKYFSLLDSAYNVASSGNVIQARSHDFNENLVLDKNIAIIIKGGYDSGYAANADYTTLHGSLTIESGALTAENLVIE